jgi:hypothetical protein
MSRKGRRRLEESVEQHPTLKFMPIARGRTWIMAPALGTEAGWTTGAAIGAATGAATKTGAGACCLVLMTVVPTTCSPVSG